MVCDHAGIDEIQISTIINELGDFSKETIPLKYFARIG
jgi:hypothetical protein